MVLLIFVIIFIYEKVKKDNLVRDEFLLHNEFGCTRANQRCAKSSLWFHLSVNVREFCPQIFK